MDHHRLTKIAKELKEGVKDTPLTLKSGDPLIKYNLTGTLSHPSVQFIVVGVSTLIGTLPPHLRPVYSGGC